MGEMPRVSRRGVRIMSYWLAAGLAALLDQATKAAIRVLSPEVGRIGTLIPGLFDLYHVENSGAAFSIGEGAGILFVVIAVAVIGLTFAFVCTQDVPLSLTISLACVAGGGAGNMVDRLANGTVTDFIATTFMNFPVFNVADMFVTCGAVLSFLLYVRWEKKREQEEVARV